MEQLMQREAVLEHAPNATINQGASQTHLVVFESRREAIFKPFSGQNPAACAGYQQDPVEAVLHEVAAWRLAATMGAPWDQLVPAAVLRALPLLEGGALVNKRRGMPDTQVFEDARAQADAAGFWDSLVGQQDRHATNFRYDAEPRSLALIDHAFSFALPGHHSNGAIFGSRRHAEGRQNLTEAEMQALDAILGSGDLHGLRNYILEDRADAFEARARKMLETKMLMAPGVF
ncbi:MAG TPA: hypothetical protein VHY18_02510 [Solirubrobacteraceae bacterium]|nr:hypothetical protein [Solirubrobacteraceae bacterium]